MGSKYVLFAVFILFLQGALQAQKSKKYYTQLNKAEDYLIEGKADSALLVYDEVLFEFDYPFYRHVRQAAIIAKLSKDYLLLDKYLRICVKKGMNQYEFEFFESELPNILCFDEYKKMGVNLIDSALFLKYVELDAIDEFFHTYEYAYSKDSVKHKYYRWIQKESKNIYFDLMKNEGLPTEKNVGLSYGRDVNTVFKFHKSSKIHYLSNYCNQFNVDSIKVGIYDALYTARAYHDRPGNWFYWHYEFHESKDSVWIALLIESFNALLVSRADICRLLELGELQSDMFTTYYSQNLRLLNYQKIEQLPQINRESINANREKLFIRSLEKQELLELALYNIKFKSKEKEMSRRKIKKIKFEAGMFNSYNVF